MCGHVGIAGKLELKDEATLKRLLVYDYFRGPDSTGLAVLKNTGEVKIAKIASHPLDLFDSNRFKAILNGAGSSAFIGHNRLATKGLVNAVNAHPYEYGHIVGAHNGTLEKSSWDKLNEILGEPTAVDSQAIFACIEKVGIEETVKHLQGAWALVWIDTKLGTLNFLRNKERSFWYAYEEGFKKVMWASEYPIMQAATKLSTTEYKMALDPEGHCYFSTAENWWYRFDLEELALGSDTRPKPKVKELKGKEPAPVVSYAGRTPFIPTTTTTTSRGTTHTSTNSNSNTDVINLMAWRKDPFRGYLKEEEFKEITQYGCSWCASSIEYGEPGVIIYERDGVCLCPSCAMENDKSKLYVSASRLVM